MKSKWSHNTEHRERKPVRRIADWQRADRYLLKSARLSRRE